MVVDKLGVYVDRKLHLWQVVSIDGSMSDSDFPVVGFMPSCPDIRETFTPDGKVYVMMESYSDLIAYIGE